MEFELIHNVCGECEGLASTKSDNCSVCITLLHMMKHYQAFRCHNWLLIVQLMIILSCPCDIFFQDENQLLRRIDEICKQNKVWRSFIGMGFYNCVVPNTIMRNIFENPGW